MCSGKTASAQQSGVKLKRHFEIVEGLLYTMQLHLDPNNSVVSNPEPDRQILKPKIKIAGNSLVDGPFTVTRLVENETVGAELRADATAYDWDFLIVPIADKILKINIAFITNH
jgi:hypothetical protein